MAVSRYRLLLCAAALAIGAPAGAQVAERDWFPGTSSIREAEIIPPAYRGIWGQSDAHCRAHDGNGRIEVMAHGLDTEETGARLERVAQAGAERSIRVRLAHEGEGEFWESVETWTLDPSGERLTIVHEAHRSTMILVRCTRRRR